MRELTTRDEVDEMLQEGEAVLLKHGATCPISAAAREQMTTFCAERRDVSAYGLEVTGRRELSDYVAERLGVPHESPQALVLRGGRPVWRAEHFDIDASGISRALGR
jgi:bacillithiol system protein YtxJ